MGAIYGSTSPKFRGLWWPSTIARGDEDAKEEEAAEQRRDRSVALTAACQDAFYDLRLEESRSACEEATTLDENNFAARLGYGWALLELGETEKALQVASDAVDVSWNEGVDDATDKAIHLRAAALTVDGDHDDAKDLIRERLDGSPRANELRARLALLEGRPAPREWVTYVAPRYFCWKAKGDANAYLLRRGFLKPETFTTGFAALSDKRRVRLETSGKTQCPWKDVV
jgi:tetratricopeptide (TPR) repeat protein